MDSICSICILLLNTFLKHTELQSTYKHSKVITRILQALRMSKINANAVQTRKCGYDFGLPFVAIKSRIYTPIRQCTLIQDITYIRVCVRMYVLAVVYIYIYNVAWWNI